MTTAVLAARPAAGALPLSVVLGLQEGARIVRHPIALLGLLYTAVTVLVVGDNGPRDAFDVLSVGPTFSYGVLVYFAAHLVATRDRRACTTELLSATPAPVTHRVAGLCVAALLPAAVCAGFVAGVHVMQTARDLYVVAPGVWHLVQAPLTVLGGALLGIMVSRWTTLPGAALLVMVAMVAANVRISNAGGSLGPLGTQVSWAVWGDGREWVGLHPGSPAWHAGYLAALCAMAATGAFLRAATHTWRVLAIGAGFSAVAVVTGVLQLP